MYCSLCVAARGGGVTRSTDVVGAHGLQTGHGGRRAHSPVVMGITVVRAMARHRWRHSQYVGLTRVQLEHSRRRADREHQRQAREQAERRSEEVVRMAQEHYFPWRPEW